jgi:hypothetical protein
MAMPRGTEWGGFLRRSWCGMPSPTVRSIVAIATAISQLANAAPMKCIAGIDSDDVAGRGLNTRSTPTYSGDVAAQLVWRSDRSVEAADMAMPS